MGCTAEILCTPRCNPKPGSFRGLVNFSLRRTVAELRGIKVPNFRILAYFPHTKPVKRIFQWPAYRMIPIFHVVVESPKGCLPAAEFSCNFWYGSWGPPNLPKFLPMANGYIHTECNYTARQILTKDVWKRAILSTDVLSAGWRMRQNHIRLLYETTWGQPPCWLSTNVYISRADYG